MTELAPWPLLRELGPAFFEVPFPGERHYLAEGQPRGQTDLWVFTLAWLALRSFSELASVTWPGDDDLGKLQLSVAELIDRAEDEGAAVAGGVREELAVLGDKLQASGDPWGLWIAALLSGSVVARQEHEAALARAVRAVRAKKRSRVAGIAGSFELPVGLFGHMQAGLGSAVDAMQEFNRAMAALGPVVEQLCGTLGEVAGVLDQEAPPKEVEQRFGPVGDRLRRRLGRGRR